VAGLAGGVGVAAIFTNTWLCTNVSPYLSGEFVWYSAPPFPDFNPASVRRERG
jgi:hypothetical protein